MDKGLITLKVDDEMFKQSADISPKFAVIKEPGNLDEVYTHEIIDMVLEE